MSDRTSAVPSRRGRTSAASAPAPAPVVEEKTVMTNSFFNEGVELEHSWISTGTQKLSKEEIESISSIRVRNGKYGLQVAFMMKSGKTRVFSLSQYCEQFTPGTVLRPSSIVIEELYDEEEERYIYRVSGEAM